MTWNPKLVALDIDGTLVDFNGKLPQEVQLAVKSIVEADVPVVLSTGRGWPATKPIIDMLDLPDGWIVMANGALVAKYKPLKICHHETFDPAAIISEISRVAPQALIAVDEGISWRASGEFPPGELGGEVVYETLQQLASRPVTRVVLRAPDADENEFKQITARLGLNEVSYFMGWSGWLDIAPLGVDKSTGLQKVCRRLRVSRKDVLALGDGNNDIEMLTWAGRGVAMGDAPEQVKQAADYVTSTFSEGGTVGELSRWFDICDEEVA